METERNEEQAEVRGGLTLGDYLRMIFQWKHLCILLAAAIAAFAVVWAVIRYVVNPSKQQYSMTFRFSVSKATQSTEEIESGHFFVSPSTLGTVKSSDNSFAFLDLDRMENGEIYVTREVNAVGGTEEIQIVETTYTLTARADLFRDSKMAQLFLSRLVKSVETKSKELADGLAAKGEDGFNGYEPYMRGYENAFSFEEQIEILRNQRDYLVSCYDSWIDAYSGNFYVPELGLTLSSLRASAKAAFSDAYLKRLDEELDACGYVLAGAEKDLALKARQTTLENMIESNTQKITALQASLDTLLEQYTEALGSSSSLLLQFDEYNTRIAALSEENAELNRKLNIINAVLASDESAQNDYFTRVESFEQSVDGVRDAINAEAGKCATAAQALAGETYVSYSELHTTGGTNAVLMALVVAVLVFAAGAVIVCVICRTYRRTGEPAEPVPAEEGDAAPTESSSAPTDADSADAVADEPAPPEHHDPDNL